VQGAQIYSCSQSFCCSPPCVSLFSFSCPCFWFNFCFPCHGSDFQNWAQQANVLTEVQTQNSKRALKRGAPRTSSKADFQRGAPREISRGEPQGRDRRRRSKGKLRGRGPRESCKGEFRGRALRPRSKGEVQGPATRASFRGELQRRAQSSGSSKFNTLQDQKI